MTVTFPSTDKTSPGISPVSETGLSCFFDHLTSDSEKNIHIIVQEVGKALDCTFGLYCLVDEEVGLLFVRDGFQIPNELKRVMPGKGHICFEEKIWQRPDPVIFEDLETTRFLETDHNIREFGLKSFVGHCIPLEGKLSGCLCMFDNKRRPFLPSDIENLVILSKALSLEERRRKSFKNLINKLSLEEMLFEISSRAISMRSLEIFLEECVEIIGRALNVGGIFVWKYDAETDSVHNVAGGQGGALGLKREAFQNIPGVLFPWDLEQLKQEGILQYDDIEALEEGTEKEKMRKLNLKSMLMFPLFSKDVFYGTLGIEIYDQPRKWPPRIVAALTSVSNVMTKSIEGHISEEELKKAKDGLEEQVKLRTEKLDAALKEVEREHKKTLLREAQLEELNQELLEMNQAVTVLARNVKREKNTVMRDISQLISSKIMPLIDELRGCKTLERKRSYLDMIYGYLKEVEMGMAEESCGLAPLTISEMRVASLINKGLTSPQIANRLNLSQHTVKTHRKRIRKKMGIRNEDVNLASYLTTFFQTEASRE